MECEELEFHSQMKLPTDKSIEAAENARKKMCRMTDQKGSPQNNKKEKSYMQKTKGKENGNYERYDFRTSH